MKFRDYKNFLLGIALPLPPYYIMQIKDGLWYSASRIGLVVYILFILGTFIITNKIKYEDDE